MNSTFEDVFNSETIAEAQEKSASNKLNDLVYDSIESAILSLRLRPGCRLNTADIARNLGVSITPVKNAIQKLSQNGLVSEKPGFSGYFVFDIDDHTIESVFAIRQCIEGFSAYECARRLPLIDTAPLRKLADGFYDAWMRFAEGHETPENRIARSQLDILFHRAVLDAAGNQFLIDAYKSSSYRSSYVNRRAFEYWDVDTNMDFRKIVAGQHRNIVNAIETGIPEFARKAAEDHVLYASSRSMLYRAASKSIESKE